MCIRDSARALASHDWAGLAARASELAALGARLAGARATLRLTPRARGESAVLVDATNASMFDAWFALPAALAPGEYEIALANALAPAHFAPLAMFESKARPRVASVDVVGAAPPAAPERGGAVAAVAAAARALDDARARVFRVAAGCLLYTSPSPRD